MKWLILHPLVTNKTQKGYLSCRVTLEEQWVEAGLPAQSSSASKVSPYNF